MRYWAARVFVGAMTSVALVVAVACGGAAESPADGPPPTASQPARQPSAGAPVRIALASSDLSVGPNRVVLGLIEPDAGPILNARVQVSTFFIGGGPYLMLA